MLELIIIHMVAALFAPILIKIFRRGAYAILALIPLTTAIWTAIQTPRVLAGDYPAEYYPWLPDLGLNFTFRLDALAWLMGLIVSFVGALILIYSAGYFSKGAQAMGRFAGVFVAFAGAMYGLVTTDNTLVLYIFWELTTIFSFLLIGHYHERQASRRAASQAIIVTTLGGLAMLAGIIILGVAREGSFTISTLVAKASDTTLFTENNPWLISIAILLVLGGALTKSAQIPFHFWLPAAMAAPTPVSSYLHAAAMVKGGVYLVARLAPGFADLGVWQFTILAAGLATMLIGGLRALKQFDLKLLLAYGTVSQLGFIIMLVGYGTQPVALAGLTMLAAHALFKSTLFMVVGTIDHELGTRDLRQLSGLAKAMPALVVVASLGAASMAGIAPLLGYLGKEAALAALYDDGAKGVICYLIVIAGSILTMAYTLRFWWGAFVNKPGITDCRKHRIGVRMMTPMSILAALSLGLGVVPGLVEKPLSSYAANFVGGHGHLALWAGFGPALYGTLAVIGLGVIVFVLFGARLEFDKPRIPIPLAEDVYRKIIGALNKFSKIVTARVQRGSLPSYLSTMLSTMVIAAMLVLIVTRPPWPTNIRLWDSPAQAGVAVVSAIAAVMVVGARRRMKAVLLLSAVGYLIALLFVLQGAPDLALTQIVVETVSLVVFVLVMRRLPLYFSNRPWSRARISRVIIGAVVGITVALLGWFAASARIHEPVTIDYPSEVFDFGYGRNIVNVTLVDTRAWDTIGEISVALAAATGVASLIFLRQRLRSDINETLQNAAARKAVWATGHTDRIGALAKPSRPIGPARGRIWLAGSMTLARVRRSLIFEIGARMTFYPMLLFSLYLLFAGHNAPGGGFAGGMLAGIALVIRYLAGGRYELALAVNALRPGWFLGVGMLVATAAALVPIVFGGTVLQTTVFHFTLPIYGDVHLATALFFDIGVYLIVIGLVLDILTSLGGEIDRQGEKQGEQAPDISFDDPQEIADDAVGATLDARSRDD